jgi:DNA-binding GntR family transcriptional regulator
MGYNGPSTPIFRGGKHLEAIATSTRLNRTEKAVLHAIASQMKIGGDFKEGRWMYVAEISDRTGMSRRTVFRALKTLKDQQYIHVNQQKDERGLAASQYFLSSRVFYEYREFLQLRLVTNDPGDIMTL